MTAQAERHFGVDHGWVQITNGLDEGLHVAAQAARLIDPAFEAIVVEPAFEMYAACIEAVGGRQVTVAPAPDLTFPVEAVLAAISPRTRLIYLCDPNNPSGLPIPADTSFEWPRPRHRRRCSWTKRTPTSAAAR